MKKDDKFIIFLKDTMKTIVIYLVIIIILTQYIIRPFRVEGESMTPALLDAEMGISSIISKNFGDIHRFDIVIVYVEDTQKYLVKRVIGMPNETIEFDGNKLYIDGKHIEETFFDMNYVNSQTDDGTIDFTTDFGPVELKNDEYFLMGDNRLRSSDSRIYGPFKKDQIKSKNGIIFYPLNKIRKIGGDFK